MRRLLTLCSLFVLCAASISHKAAASPQPLPAIPSITILNQVITQTGGPTYTPLNVTDYVLTQLDANFTGVLAGVRNKVSVFDTISYIATGSHLLESVMPLNNSATAQLVADITTPGDKPRPGKIVGVLFQPTRMVQIIVATFKPSEPNKIEKARFYWNSTQYYEASAKVGQFTDADGNGQPAAIDAGAIIAYNTSCVTVGLNQFCWEPYKKEDVRDGNIPKDMVHDAHDDFKHVYDLDVDFHESDALPDLIGPTRRDNCARQMKLRLNWRSMMDCTPNLVFGAAKEFQVGQPVAIFVVREAADLKTFTHTGVYTGSLPAGSYLVIPATPNVTTDGSVGVLFLVNLDTQNHYLIPAIRMQGVAEGITTSKKSYAVIKDGSTGSWGF